MGGGGGETKKKTDIQCKIRTPDKGTVGETKTKFRPYQLDSLFHGFFPLQV